MRANVVNSNRREVIAKSATDTAETSASERKPTGTSLNPLSGSSFSPILSGIELSCQAAWSAAQTIYQMVLWAAISSIVVDGSVDLVSRYTQVSYMDLNLQRLLQRTSALHPVHEISSSMGGIGADSGT